MGLFSLLEEKRDSKKIAVIDRGISYTYAGLWNDVLETKHLWDERISRKNVLIYLDNSYEFILSYFAAVSAAKNVALSSKKLSRKEVLSLCSYLEIDIVITDITGQRLLGDDSCQNNFSLLVVGEENQNSIKKDEIILFNECSVILGSSGTSGTGKRVVLSEQAIVKNAKMHIKEMQYKTDERFLVCLPMCFGYCHTAQFIASIVVGGTIVIERGPFLPQSFWRTCLQYQVTTCTLVPTQIYMLLKSKRSEGFYKLKTLCFGGAKIQRSSIFEFLDRYKDIDLIETYGMTELGPRVSCLNLSKHPDKIGSVGKPMDKIKVKIIDKNGNEVRAKAPGEIWIWSPCRMTGYYANPAETAKVLREGWFQTGDIGFQDEAGYLFIAGREKNIIICGGINVYPEEYENIINNFDGVDECIVYGKPDDLLGERVVADIVVNNNFCKHEFMRFCSCSFGQVKISEVNQVRQIPKTYNGKIKRVKQYYTVL